MTTISPLERAITFPIRLLDQGQVVADLQQALTLLDGDVATREIDAQRFGRTTRDAVIRFQRQHNQRATGEVDEATAARLNRELERRGLFQPKARPFANRNFLRFKPQEPERLDPDARDFVRQRLNGELKEEILRQFHEPSDSLQAAVRRLALDYEQVADEPLAAIIIERVIPVLLEAPDLEGEVEGQAHAGFAPSTETVRSLLSLDRDLRQHPFFQAESRRAKNAALGAIAGLSPSQIQAIEDLDLEVLEEETWGQLVTDNILDEREREELANAVELSTLSDDKFETVDALRAEGRNRLRDLVTLNRAGWQAFLARHGIAPPEGDNQESYARLLDLNVQRTLPTAYTMQRLVVDQARDEVLRRTADLEPILAGNEVIFAEGRIVEDLDWGDIAGDERARLEGSLRELNRFANVYRPLGVADILNDHDLTPEEKQQAIRQRRSALQTFHRNNPDLDLAWVNFHDADSEVGRAFRPSFADLSEEDGGRVRRTMMSWQRTLKLTESVDESEALLAGGFDSALAILNVPEQEFAKEVQLPPAVSRRIYAKASNTAVQLGHFLSIVDETTTHAPFLPNVLDEAAADVPNLGVINLLKKIDGYEDLFGNQNYCHCAHCRSIFSPAAYFVDLMDFIHEHISRPVFVEKNATSHALYLRRRRPDLWTLPLSCDNTNTLVSYLTIVNEVLERYLHTVFEDDVFEALTQARLSFRQPFNLPFAALQLYLGHFRVKLVDVYELFALPASAVARARLGCSPEEFATIITPNTLDIQFRYGMPEDLQVLDVQDLIRHAGVTREELDRLLDLEFITGRLVPEITVKSPGNDLVGFGETLRLAPAGAFLIDHNLLIRHFLDRLHRFVRLWRKLPWTLEELHLVIMSLIDPRQLPVNLLERTHALGQLLNEEMVVQIADLHHIQERLGLSLEELYALYREIPTLPLRSNRPALFARLFGEREALTIAHPALVNAASDNPAVSPDFGLLQGALRLPETQVLELLGRLIPETVIQNRRLGAEHLSTLYRHAQLGRLLGTNPVGLSHVASLLELNFDIASPRLRIVALLGLIDFINELKKTPFSVDEVWWLVTGEASGSVASRIEQDQVDALLEQLRADPRLTFPLEALAGIEGVAHVEAQALLSRLAEEPLGWVERSGEAQERYTLTPAFALPPDLTVLIDFFSQAGDTQAVAQTKAEQVAEQLRSHHPHALLMDHLARHFNVNGETLDALWRFLPSDLTDATSIVQIFAWLDPANSVDTGPILASMRILERLLVLFREKLALPPASLPFIASRRDLFALVLPIGLSWESLHLLSIYADFVVGQRTERDLLHGFLLAWTAAPLSPKMINWLARILKTEASQISSLAANLDLPATPLEALATLALAVQLAGRLGLNGAALAQLTAANYAGLNAAKDLVYGAILAKYDEKEWSEIVEPYEDKLNIIKRDALVDRVLSKEFQLRFSDARQIYQFFLLDVEMDGCARISRVVEAISACQLYVHRCRMNLEQSESGDVHVSPARIPADEWIWRKNYRVWEANRKVFLYPENWLEPDLRDNKTALFKHVESELLQRTITPESVEGIYKAYLRAFVELANLVIVCTLYDDSKDTYWFFARTRHDPYQYYCRTFVNKHIWTPWEKIEQTIAASTLSAVFHQGRLYLFWLNIITADNTMDLVDGSADDPEAQGKTKDLKDSQPIILEYTFRTESGTWHQPQNLKFYHFEAGGNTSLQKRVSSKVYPESQSRIRAIHSIRYKGQSHKVVGYLDEYENTIVKRSGGNVEITTTEEMFAHPKYRTSGLKLLVSGLLYIGTHSGLGFKHGSIQYYKSEPDAEADLFGHTSQHTPVALFPFHHKNDLRIVHARLLDNVLNFQEQQFLIYRTDQPGYKKQIGSLLEAAIAVGSSKRRMVRLTTTVADELAQPLFERGLEAFLDLQNQEQRERPLEAQGAEFIWLGEIVPPVDGPLALGPIRHLNFNGAYGVYFRELFFHIPFLIAHYLNASQKFAEADFWYRRIFDPTADETPVPSKSTRRNWRYVEFRHQRIPKLREILTDAAAIDQYKTDPFNPFAIARLRVSAFQKAIVMKYVDNLLDWGDHLFAQDTFESLNEAMMLYVMAADILGDRPIQVGECNTTEESLLTYQRIHSRQLKGSEFLIELENLLSFINADVLHSLLAVLGMAKEDNEAVAPGAGFAALSKRVSQPTSYAQIKSTVVNLETMTVQPFHQVKIAAKTSAQTAVQRTLAFCVPPNDTLLGYWDRVEDRLYKIRHCMNLQGVRRELALFQPPIDPGLLVKAKAAGLSLEEALGLLVAEVPAYRFSYMVEKAKQFTGTVQNFGSALVGALEKKDTEELTLLRAVHEQALLQSVRYVKEEHRREAEKSKAAVEETQKLAQRRKVYYQQQLLSAVDLEFGMNQYEVNNLTKIGDAQDKQGAAAGADKAAAKWHQAPTFAVTGQAGGGWNWGSALGVATAVANVSWGSANLAMRKTSEAGEKRKQAMEAQTESQQAAIKGGHRRRKAEWQHQHDLALQEEQDQLQRQIEASAARVDAAQRDLDTHDRQVAQAEELHNFYRDKFTELGLYTYLSTTLSRLYREAYNLAHDMALKAQQAYRFETNDDTLFIGADNWQADRAGLLAGERLVLQLHQMEKSFLEKDRREYEITLSCPLAQIDPAALLRLRENGSCAFTIPELWFDLYYPGQYKRRIKSVRLTIPCVTGPYTNVSAKLTLTGSRTRKEPQLASQLVGVPAQRNTSVATSTANNDAGAFELPFQDPRYLPFEGAGAESDWQLELPSVLRPFDYDTISDVIVHISYTAKDDGRFREQVEDALHEFEHSLIDRLAEEELVRWFSLKQEFPGELHQLRHAPQEVMPTTTIRLGRRHFPYFLHNRNLILTEAIMVVKPFESDGFNVDDLDLQLNGTAVNGWDSFPLGGVGALSAKTFAVDQALDPGGNPWSVTVTRGDISGVEDIWFLVAYRLDS